MIFKGKTLEQIKAMKNYPFGIADESIIRCENDDKSNLSESEIMDNKDIKIWVDDVRLAPNGYKLVKSVNEFIKLAEEVGLDNIAVVDIDHDAGDF